MKLIAFSVIALAFVWQGKIIPQENDALDIPWEPVANQHYHAINIPVDANVTPEQTSELKLEKHIIKFYFWPGSESCYQLDQALRAWHEQHPQIQIDRIPLVKRPQWRLLAKAWLVAKQMDDEMAFLDELYQQIHDKRQPIENYFNLEQFIISRNIDPLNFKTQFNALSTNQQLQSLQLQADKLSIAGVPTIIINNRWYTDASTGVSSAKLITIITQLIYKNEPDDR